MGVSDVKTDVLCCKIAVNGKNMILGSFLPHGRLGVKVIIYNIAVKIIVFKLFKRNMNRIFNIAEQNYSHLA